MDNLKLTTRTGQKSKVLRKLLPYSNLQEQYKQEKRKPHQITLCGTYGTMEEAPKQTTTCHEIEWATENT